ncbi:MAG TPA: nitrate/nitrite transporter NrtS [Stellaceae bacterium]|nr:nitrate/nitrite transporter NrtS [Stellaceae bacterium]
MNRMNAIGRLWRYATADGVPKRSLVIALIVGTILNAINQGDRLLLGMAPDITKLLLTYLVPYCVSTYGAVSYRLHAARPAASDPTPYPAG